jgi:hypothetical protein
MADGFRAVRASLDAFNPDFVLIFGDDQYENFREDCVPAFQVCAHDEFVIQPHSSDRPNSWNEPPETTFRFDGRAAVGRWLTGELIDEGFDLAYSYKALREEMAHAFANTILFLDWDRIGWRYPVLPFATNCYGRMLIHLRGMGINSLADVPTAEQLDPPAPPPWRCFELGRAIGRLLAASPWRVALVASASWSHAWLSRATSFYHPSVEADRVLLAALERGDYESWRTRTTTELEDHGQQELLNWHLMLGAMAELERRPDEIRFMESWVTNADKAFAVFRP